MNALQLFAAFSAIAFLVGALPVGAIPGSGAATCTVDLQELDAVCGAEQYADERYIQAHRDVTRTVTPLPGQAAAIGIGTAVAAVQLGVQTTGKGLAAAGSGAGGAFALGGQSAGDAFQVTGSAAGDGFRLAGDAAGDAFEATGSTAGAGFTQAGATAGQVFGETGTAAATVFGALEPDVMGQSGLGDWWEQWVCEKYNLGDVSSTAEDVCNLHEELPQVGIDCGDPLDLDCDGLTLLEEFCWNTDPLDADTDNDRWLDGPESEYWKQSDDEECVSLTSGYIARYPSANRDDDGDGRPNIRDRDADNDYLQDGDERYAEYSDQSTRPERRDTDADGLSDYEELCDTNNQFNDYACALSGWHSDPNLADTDGDGADDHAEASYWTTERAFVDFDEDGSVSNLRDPDSDGDSHLDTANALDGDELNREPRLDPGNWDSDGDSIPDGYELFYELDPAVRDGELDADNDGATNWLEYAWQRPANWDEATDGAYLGGLNPQDRDMDGDLLLDGQEIHGTLNPFQDHAFYPNYPGSTNVLAQDTDGDSISDHTELMILIPPSNPNNPFEDADGDGLLNFDELNGWMIYLNRVPRMVTSDPADADTDDDGLNDGEEKFYHSHPRKIDGDGDSLLDIDEVGTYASLGCLPNDADTDGDTLRDDVEVALGTRCDLSDTDGDGLWDHFEARNPTGWQSDPLKPDTDGDGLDDAAELLAETDPNNVDTDGDGLWDGEEQGVLDPNNPDSDGDLILDYDELYVFDTNPNLADTDFDGYPDFYDPRPRTEDVPPAIASIESDDFRLGFQVRAIDATHIKIQDIQIEGPGQAGTPCTSYWSGFEISVSQHIDDRGITIFDVAYSEQLFYCDLLTFDLRDSNNNTVHVSLRGTQDFTCASHVEVEEIPMGFWGQRGYDAVTFTGAVVGGAAAGGVTFVATGNPYAAYVATVAGAAGGAAVSSMVYDAAYVGYQDGFSGLQANSDRILHRGLVAGGEAAFVAGMGGIGVDVMGPSLLDQDTPNWRGEATITSCGSSQVSSMSATAQDTEGGMVIEDPAGYEITLFTPGFYLEAYRPGDVPLEDEARVRGGGMARIVIELGDEGLAVHHVVRVIEDPERVDRNGHLWTYCGEVYPSTWYEFYAWHGVSGQRAQTVLYSASEVSSC